MTRDPDDLDELRPLTQVLLGVCWAAALLALAWAVTVWLR